MIYLFYGTDKAKVSGKFKNLLDSLVAKKPDVALFRVNDENFKREDLEELILGQSLFDKKYIIGCRNLALNTEAAEFIKNNAQLMADSPHIFIMAEEKLPAELKKVLARCAEKLLKFDRPATKPVSAFNVFSLGDSLGLRDRRMLWLNFVKAGRYDVLPEEIYWQYLRGLKSMLLVKKTAEPESLGLHPFVIQKARKYAKNFTTAELEKLHHQLVMLYHEVRSGRRDMAVALELFLLEI